MFKNLCFYFVVAVTVALNASADFPYHTNTGTFNAETNATGDYNAFSWAWNGYDDQVITTTFLPVGFSNVYMRMSYPRRGTVFMDLQDGTTTSNSYSAFVSKTNIPPAGVYWTEFVGFVDYATNVPTRVLATGKITVQHSTFQNTNQATWVNPLAGTVIGPPFHTLSDLSLWPFTTTAASGLNSNEVSGLIGVQAYPLAGNPSNFLTSVDLSFTNNYSQTNHLHTGVYQPTGNYLTNEAAWLAASNAVIYTNDSRLTDARAWTGAALLGTAAYSNANAFATAAQGAVADAASSTNATQDGIIAGLSTNKYSQANGEAASNLASSAKADAGVVSGRVDIVVGNLTSVSNAAAQALSDAGTVSGRVDALTLNLGSVSGTVVTVSGNLTSVSNTASSAKTTADAALPKAGGTMSGTLNMAGNNITGIGTNTFADGTMLFTTGGVLRVGSGTNLNTVVTDANISSFEAPTPVYCADPATMKKVGTTFSVSDWIPRNLVLLHADYLVTKAANSGGLLDGPGYLFNDQNGLLVGQSTNYTWKNVGYDNKSSGGVAAQYHWTFNDNTNTAIVLEIISGNNGTNTQDTSLDYVAGKINGARLADPEAACSMPRVVLANNSTLSFWIKLPAAGLTGWHTVIARNASPDYTSLLLSGDIFLAGSGGQVSWSFSPTAETWYHIAYVVSGSVSELFIDGVSKGTKTTPGTLTMDKVCFAGIAAIDDLRVYDISLTSVQVEAIYSASNEVTGYFNTNTMTLVCTNKIVDFLPTATWMSILASGSGLTTNDAQGFVSPDYGINWYQADLTPSTSLDLSNTLFQGTAIYTNNVTSSNMTLKAVTTSNKVVKILGMWGPSN